MDKNQFDRLDNVQDDDLNDFDEKQHFQVPIITVNSLPGGNPRGLKRPFTTENQHGETERTLDNEIEQWDLTKDDFLKKIREVKKPKIRDVDSDRMKLSKIPERLSENRLQTISECGEMFGPIDALTESVKAQSQIVRCKIPINFANAASTPKSSKIGMYRRMQSEHLQLERSYARLRQLVDSDIVGIQTENKPAKSADERSELMKTSKSLQIKVCQLQEKVQEYQEQNELLEFRILEFDHCQPKKILKNCGSNTELYENKGTPYATLSPTTILKNNPFQCLTYGNDHATTECHLEKITVMANSSEDEGLGEDTKRDSSSGPSSLTDIMDTTMDTSNDLQNNLRVLNEMCTSESERTILQLEEKLANLQTSKDELQEQVLELEEAENDARLESQTLRSAVDRLQYREMELETDLVDARFQMGDLEKQSISMKQENCELVNQISYMRELIEKYEDRIQELETVSAQLKSHLESLNQNILTETPILNSSQKIQDATRGQNLATQTEGKDNQEVEGNLLSRLEKLEAKDCLLKDQLHVIDGKNLKLWAKLHAVDAEINECRRIDQMSNDEISTDQPIGLLNSVPKNRTKLLDDIDVQEEFQTVRESRLVELENANREFEKELEIREKLFRQKETDTEEWKIKETILLQTITLLREEAERVITLGQSLEVQQKLLFGTLQETIQRKSDLQAFHSRELANLDSEHQIVNLNDVIEKQKSVEEECQTEITSLRNEVEIYNSNITGLLERRTQLEEALADKEEEMTATKNTFQKKLKLLEEEHHLVEKELQWRLKEMEEGTTVAVKALEAKRKQLQLNMQDDMQDLKSKEFCYKSRIGNLEKHIEGLKQEAEVISANGSHADNEIQFNAEETFECLSLEERLEELEKKECAYAETLENADKIISQMELSYRSKIKDLESSEKTLQNRVQQLEENEEKLKLALQNARQQTEGWKVSELVKDLMDVETRELALKHHVKTLESTKRDLAHKNSEMLRLNSQLEEELKDQEEVIVNLSNNRTKAKTLNEEVSKLRHSESALKETLKEADEILVQRELILLKRIEEMEHERLETDEVVGQLRTQVHLLQEKLENIQLESSAMERHEFINQEFSNFDSDLREEANSAKETSMDEETAGIEARTQLDQCYLRVVKALKNEYENGQPLNPNLNYPVSPSTSGCESDTGSESRWPSNENQHRMSEDENEATWDSERSRTFSPQKHVKSLEIPEPVVELENWTFSEPESPRNLQVLRQVGKDSLLVSWCIPSDKSAIQCYKIYVDDRIHQHVRSSDRTKALLHKLSLQQGAPSFSITIRGVSESGKLSAPASISYDPSFPISTMKSQRV